MEYALNPLPWKFRELTRAEATEYFALFTMQIPLRIRILEQVVQSRDGYSNWIANYTPVSLTTLATWYFQQVETRPRTAEEMEAIYAKAPNWLRQVKFDDWELTSRTYSLAIDIGMYMGCTLQLAVPRAKWKLVTKPANGVDYQRPVLVGSGKLAFSPIQIMSTFAYGIARHAETPERLRELFEIWKGILSG